MTSRKIVKVILDCIRSVRTEMILTELAAGQNTIPQE